MKLFLAEHKCMKSCWILKCAVEDRGRDCESNDNERVKSSSNSILI
jgi:hypothetical protein